MLQVDFPEAEGWRDCFLVSGKTESAALAVARKFRYRRAVRIIDRKGRTTFSWEPS